MLLFATPAGQALGEEIAERLSRKLGKVHFGKFKDGELDVRIQENVRDRDVYIIAPLHAPTRNFFEAILLANAARDSSAGRVSFVIPYMGYARADRKAAPRMPIGVRVAFDILGTARPDRFIILDIHAEQSLAIVRDACDHLYGSAVLVPKMKQVLASLDHDFVVASPDEGGGKRAMLYARLLGKSGFVFFSKNREKAGEVDEASVKIIGEVKGKVVLLVDDMIDSGGTIIADATVAMEQGATSVIVCATHGLLSDGAIQKIENSDIAAVYITNSVHHKQKKLAKSTKIHVESVGTLLAEAVHRTHEGESLSELIL